MGNEVSQQSCRCKIEKAGRGTGQLRACTFAQKAVHRFRRKIGTTHDTVEEPRVDLGSKHLKSVYASAGLP